MSIPDDERRFLIDSFQQTMAAFLETQKEVMLALLHPTGSGAGLAPEASAPEALPRLEPLPDLTTWQPPEPAAAPPRVPVEPVEPVPAEPVPEVVLPQAVLPDRSPMTADEPGAPRPADGRDVSETLLTIVEDRTGYPRDMLDLDLQMEADLGMDSIKRGEIIGTLQRTLRPEEPLDAAAMDDLTRARTLRALVEGFAGAATARSDVGSPDRDSADREGDRAHV